MAVGSVLGSLASGGIQFGTNTASSYINSVFSDSNNKDSQARASSYSLKSALYDYIYNRMAFRSDTDYSYDKSLEYARTRDEDEYALAKRYAENSASWEKQGLENANINPILAYGSIGGNINYSASNQGLTSSTGSGVSVGAPSSGSSGASGDGGVDIAEIMRDLSSLDQMDANTAKTRADTTTIDSLRDSLVSSAKSDANTKSLGADLSRAQIDKVKSEANEIDANTAKSLVDTINKSEQGGNTGWSGLATRTVSSLSRNDDQSRLNDKVRKALDNTLKSIQQRKPVSPVVDHHKGSTHTPNTARSRSILFAR